MTKLNLGCGHRKLEGYINIDVRSSVNPDMVLDFRQLPMPFKNEEAEEVHIDHALEHVSYRLYPALLIEFNRILAPGGRLILKVPDLKDFVKHFVEYVSELAYSQSMERKLTAIENFWGRFAVALNGDQRNDFDIHSSIFDYGYYLMLLNTYGFKDITENYNNEGLIIGAIK